MKDWLKALAGAVCNDYQINRIYDLNLDLNLTDEAHGDAVIDDRQLDMREISSTDEVLAAEYERMRDHAWYSGDHSLGFGIWENGALVCMCWFWTPGRAAMPQRFAKIESNEAVMVDLLTAPQCRGKGYALALTRFATQRLRSLGYKRLWTWVWHSNAPSIRVFDKAGWRYSHFLIEVRFSQDHDYLALRLPAIGG